MCAGLLAEQRGGTERWAPTRQAGELPYPVVEACRCCFAYFMVGMWLLGQGGVWTPFKVISFKGLLFI